MDDAVRRRKRFRDFWRKNNLQEVDDKLLEPLFSIRMIRVLCRGPGQELILYVDYSQFFPKDHDIRAVMKYFGFIMHTILLDETTQRNGVIVVGSGFSWANFSLQMEKVIAEMFQDVYPVRVVQVNMMQPPWYISMVLGMMKPFLSKKMTNRIKSIHTYTELTERCGVTEEMVMQEMKAGGEHEGGGGGGDLQWKIDFALEWERRKEEKKK